MHPVCQTIGGAFFVSAGNVAFANTLLGQLPHYVPSVEPHSILSVGATEIRSHYSADLVPGIVQAYMKGLNVDYAIAIASSGVAVLISFGSKWRNLKGKIQVGGAA